MDGRNFRLDQTFGLVPFSDPNDYTVSALLLSVEPTHNFAAYNLAFGNGKKDALDIGFNEPFYALDNSNQTSYQTGYQAGDNAWNQSLTNIIHHFECEVATDNYRKGYTDALKSLMLFQAGYETGNGELNQFRNDTNHRYECPMQFLTLLIVVTIFAKGMITQG